MKRCKDCQQNLPLTAFYVNKGYPAGRCKTCASARQRTHYEANKATIRPKRKAYWDRTRDARLAYDTVRRRLKHSKCTPEEYEAALQLQGHKCAICGADLRTLSKHRVHADHCHTTGRARGVLCGDCNMGLGQFKDSPERLQAAIRYLASPTLGFL